MLLSGTKYADKIYDELKEKISKLPSSPKLVVLLVGDSSPSMRYVEQKKKYAQRVGIDFFLQKLPLDCSEAQLLQHIHELNHDTSVSAYIVQLPLPKHINTQKIIQALDPKKDADGFHPFNQGQLLNDEKHDMIACTPKGIMHLLHAYLGDITGKHVVIVGRSAIVGKPLAQLCIHAGATVTVCNSHTQNLKSYTKMADICISAIGKAHFFQASDVKPEALIVDVGFCVENGKIYGDFDTQSCLDAGNTITPVPGGVGPLTVAMLLENTFIAHKNHIGNMKI